MIATDRAQLPTFEPIKDQRCGARALDNAKSMGEDKEKAMMIGARTKLESYTGRAPRRAVAMLVGHGLGYFGHHLYA